MRSVMLKISATKVTITIAVGDDTLEIESFRRLLGYCFSCLCR